MAEVGKSPEVDCMIGVRMYSLLHARTQIAPLGRHFDTEVKLDNEAEEVLVDATDIRGPRSMQIRSRKCLLLLLTEISRFKTNLFRRL